MCRVCVVTLRVCLGLHVSCVCVVTLRVCLGLHVSCACCNTAGVFRTTCVVLCVCCNTAGVFRTTYDVLCVFRTTWMMSMARRSTWCAPQWRSQARSRGGPGVAQRTPPTPNRPPTTTCHWGVRRPPPTDSVPNPSQLIHSIWFCYRSSDHHNDLLLTSCRSLQSINVICVGDLVVTNIVSKHIATVVPPSVWNMSVQNDADNKMTRHWLKCSIIKRNIFGHCDLIRRFVM